MFGIIKVIDVSVEWYIVPDIFNILLLYRVTVVTMLPSHRQTTNID